MARTRSDRRAPLASRRGPSREPRQAAGRVPACGVARQGRGQGDGAPRGSSARAPNGRRTKTCAAGCRSRWEVVDPGGEAHLPRCGLEQARRQWSRVACRSRSAHTARPPPRRGMLAPRSAWAAERLAGHAARPGTSRISSAGGQADSVVRSPQVGLRGKLKSASNESWVVDAFAEPASGLHGSRCWTVARRGSARRPPYSSAPRLVTARMAGGADLLLAEPMSRSVPPGDGVPVAIGADQPRCSDLDQQSRSSWDQRAVDLAEGDRLDLTEPQ